MHLFIFIMCIIFKKNKPHGKANKSKQTKAEGSLLLVTRKKREVWSC